MFRSLVPLLAVMLSAPIHAGALRSDARFVPDAELSVARAMHTATLLADGRVVVVGGLRARDSIATIETYDPSSRRFVESGRLAIARRNHSTTLLADGRLLVAGGADANGAPLAEIERFDPATARSEIVASLHTAQAGQSATRLADGRILFAGGLASSAGDVAAASPELFDPATGRTEPAGEAVFANTLYPSTRGPIWPSATLLPGGDVLLVGNAAAERYVLEAGSFRAAGLMSRPEYRWGMFGHTTTLLRDGTLLVAGGSDDWSLLGVTERYDVASERFVPSSPMSAPRAHHTATLLPDGRVLLVGGTTSVPYGVSGTAFGGSLATSEIYDGTADAFVQGPRLSVARSNHTATRLLDGSVLIVGGIDYAAYAAWTSGTSGAVARAERYVSGGGCRKPKASGCAGAK